MSTLYICPEYSDLAPVESWVPVRINSPTLTFSSVGFEKWGTGRISLSCKIRISFTLAVLFLIAPSVPLIGKNISSCAKVLELVTY